MREIFRPAQSPEWLGQVLSSTRGALSDIWPTPLRLCNYTTTGLPPASEWAYGLAYDETTGEPKYSNGTSWSAIGGGALGVINRTLSASLTIPAGYAGYIVRYLAISAGVTLEIAAGAELEIG